MSCGSLKNRLPQTSAKRLRKSLACPSLTGGEETSAKCAEDLSPHPHVRDTQAHPGHTSAGVSMNDKTAERIAKALERIAESLSFLADEKLRDIADQKARELDAGEQVIRRFPRPPAAE